jgi:hypothetical protein
MPAPPTAAAGAAALPWAVCCEDFPQPNSNRALAARANVVDTADFIIMGRLSRFVRLMSSGHDTCMTYLPQADRQDSEAGRVV